MKTFQKTETSLASLAILLTVAAPFRIDPLLTQSSAPNAVSAPAARLGATTVKIDGSSSMAVTNQAFEQRLKTQSPSTEVKTEYQGSDAALQSLLDEKIDLASVGRPLTAGEKAKGFVAIPQTRHKIAIIVGTENPFTGDLTFEQFAKIFRGEITNWSEVGGPPGLIQVVDRPDTSDTRRAFQTYSVFKQAPFKVAASAVKLPQDDTEATIKALGTRGIGYAIADQVTNKPGVRILPMHKTLPSDPRYPYSQPLAYVYKGPEPNAAVRAFLGYAAAPTSPNPAIVTTTSPQMAPVPASSQAPATAAKDASWLPWLFLIPLLGGLWWLLKNRNSGLPLKAVANARVVPITPVSTTTSQADPVILDEQSPNLKLYEERLVADKTRQKVGDVAVSKRVETEQAQVSVPIEKERVVIERTTLTDAGTVEDVSDLPLPFEVLGEVARIETYEDIADIHKETFVREQVNVRKEVEHDTVEAQATLRKEQLDLDINGAPVVDRTGDHQ